ncbi:MAG: hydrogenase iron-sulfur subunit [Gammaproteobacteria bacterium]
MISRRHADGVMLAGCRSGDCHYRLGSAWTEQRIKGERDPYLRQRACRASALRCHGQVRPGHASARDLAALRERLRALGPLAKAEPQPARPTAEKA